MPLTLATYNVKDLLEPADDRACAVLGQKIDFLARMLRACDADVVGLQEIGPPELLAAVLDRTGIAYGERVLGTADTRGIRCAIVSRLPVREARVHRAEALSFPVFRDGDPPPFGSRLPLRRGVVQARVEASGLGAVDVFVCHFKSGRPVRARDAAGVEREPATARERAEGMLRSLTWRAAEALHLRGLVDDVLSARPDAALAVLGDMNDVPDSVVLRTLRADGDDRGGALLDCALRVQPPARFSTLHDGRPSQIDHALATAPLYARLEEARFLNAELRQHGFGAGAPNGRSGVDPSEPPTIDSDHAPLVVRFG